MAIHPIEYRYGSQEMKNIFDQESRLQKLLDVEAALARAHAKLGNIPSEAADIISKKATTELVKVKRVEEIEAEIRHDLMAVVKALAEQCGESGGYVHLGATSYDIIDSANALQFQEALEITMKDLLELEGAFLSLAEKHKETVAVGRTHGQHAIPITYGLKFSIWVTEVGRHIERLNEMKKRILVGKMSGAVGTQASFGNQGIEIQEIVMEDLGLESAMVSNQIVQRDRYAEMIMLLALIASSLDKFGKEVRNLMRTEILEVSEPWREDKQVGSSTMPHKRNPINSEKVCGLARVVKSNVFVALENVSLEHERDLTNSSNERVIISETFIILDEILKTTIKVMKGLVLRKENIRKNLELTGGMEMAESVMIALNKKGLGRQDGHELLRQLSVKSFNQGIELEKVLLESEKVREYLSPQEIARVLKPENYIGTSVRQVERVIETARKRRNE